MFLPKAGTADKREAAFGRIVNDLERRWIETGADATTDMINGAIEVAVQNAKAPRHELVNLVTFCNPHDCVLTNNFPSFIFSGSHEGGSLFEGQDLPIPF